MMKYMISNMLWVFLTAVCGAFGTLARFVNRGDKVVICSVTNGNLGHASIEPNKLRVKRMGEGATAAKVIGATFCTLEVNDTFLDSKDPATRLKMTELIRSVRPQIIITHDRDDYHDDHIETNRLVHHSLLQAGLSHVATGPPPLEEPVIVYYMDKVGGGAFLPTDYVDITETFESKERSLACHASQCEYLMEHDGLNLLYAVQVLAEYRGLQCGVRYAEAFKLSDRHPNLSMRVLP